MCRPRHWLDTRMMRGEGKKFFSEKLFPNKENSEFVPDALARDKTTFHKRLIDSL
jgi:hypothetical protein